MTNYYIVSHHYKYGTSNYLVISDHTPTAAEVINFFNIEFEDDKEEWIEIDRVNPVTL